MLDATKDDKQIEILEGELHAVGIRLNSSPPDIYYKPKKVPIIQCSIPLHNDSLSVTRLEVLHSIALCLSPILTKKCAD